MKYFRLAAALVIFLPFTLPAQPGSDSMQLSQLMDLADKYRNSGKTDSALIVSGRAAELAKLMNNRKAMGWTMAKVSEFLIDQRKLDMAGFLIAQISQTAKQLNDTLLGAVALLQTGQISMYKDDPDKAIIFFDKSIKSGLGKNPTLYLATAYNDLGFAWGMKGEYERKALFLHKSLAMYQSLKDDAGIAQVYGNLSTVYFELGNTDKAIEYGKEAFQSREKTGDKEKLSITCCNLSQYYLTVNLEEAEKYRELCERYSAQTGMESRLIHSYVTSSLLLNKLKKNKEGFEYELKVIDLLEKSRSDQRMLARRYISAAIYTQLLNMDTAITSGYFSKSISLSRRINDRYNLRDAYLNLSDFNRQQKNYSDAYTNYKKYILYRDSLVNLEKEERIAELESQYEASKKDNEIARLSNEQKIKQLEIEKQKAIIAGNTAAALQKQNEIDLLSKSKELQESKLKQQTEELEKQQLLARNNAQQLELTEKENLLNAKQLRNQKNVRNLLLASILLFTLLGITWFNRFQLKRKLEQQKSLLLMRNNISQNLHDDIGASLSNINILNELARRTIAEPEKSAAYLAKSSEDIQRISESLSDIVWNINPRYDDLHNLFIRMKRYAADMMDGKEISYELEFPEQEGKLSLTMEKRRDLYLIFKEAVNNMVKYSKATRAKVSLQTSDHTIILTVKDNGAGFDPSLVQNGNGIVNMRQRAAACGAVLNINSTPGNGTEVILNMDTA